MPTVFITRPLKNDSPFRRRLTEAGYAVTGRSLVEFRAVPFGAVPEADWIFFYSPRAVEFFLEGRTGKEICGRLAVLGPGTERALHDRGLKADFTGDGNPQTTARAFGERATGRRVLFPRARRSRQSVQRLLGDAVTVIDLVVYENRPVEQVPDDFFDVLVFTSPLNARAYFAARQRQPGQRIIAIGPSTEEALQKLEAGEVEVAVEPSEEALAEAVRR